MSSEIALPKLQQRVLALQALRSEGTSGVTSTFILRDEEPDEVEEAPVTIRSPEHIKLIANNYNYLQKHKDLQRVLNEAGQLLRQVMPFVALTITDPIHVQQGKPVDMRLAWITRIVAQPEDKLTTPPNMSVEWESIICEALRLNSRIAGLLIRGQHSFLVRQRKIESIAQMVDNVAVYPQKRSYPLTEEGVHLPFLRGQRVITVWQ